MNDYKELIARLRAIGEHLKFDKTSCVYLAADAIEQLVKERDAAVADLAEQRVCKVCTHFKIHIDDEPCNSCLVFRKDGNQTRFEWRGVKEDNDEID